MILGGDWNSRSRMWSCNSYNLNGVALENSLLSTNLVLLNNGTYTYIGNVHNSPRAIDLTLCSASLSFNIDWGVLNDSFGSEHLPITVNLSYQNAADSRTAPNNPTRLATLNTDWSKFRNIFADSLSSPSIHTEDILKRHHTLVNNIHNAVRKLPPALSGHRSTEKGSRFGGMTNVLGL